MSVVEVGDLRLILSALAVLRQDLERLLDAALRTRLPHSSEGVMEDMRAVDAVQEKMSRLKQLLSDGAQVELRNLPSDNEG